MPEEFRFTDELTHVDESRLGLSEKRDIEGLYRAKEYLAADLRERVVELEGERDLLSTRVGRLTSERDRLRERLAGLEADRPKLNPDRLVVSFGDALAEAQAELSAADYAVGSVDVELKANVVSTVDGVTLQLPDLSEPVERETLSTIRFGLRRGSDAGREAVSLDPVPDVRGRSRSTAVELLDRAGFTVGEVTTEPGDVDDVVVEQFPAPHTVAEPGAPVDLTVAEARTVEVPAVVGHEPDDAGRALRESGLVVDEDHDRERAGAPSGRVVDQDPPAGTSVREGTAVKLTLSTGPEPGDMDGTDPDAGDAGADGSSEPSDDREDDENDESTVGLQSVDGIGPTYAERLHEAGIDSLGALLDADVETLAEATGASSGRAERWLDRARTLRSER